MFRCTELVLDGTQSRDHGAPDQCRDWELLEMRRFFPFRLSWCLHVGPELHNSREVACRASNGNLHLFQLPEIPYCLFVKYPGQESSWTHVTCRENPFFDSRAVVVDKMRGEDSLNLKFQISIRKTRPPLTAQVAVRIAFRVPQPPQYEMSKAGQSKTNSILKDGWDTH